jgi:uncharacterized protein (DUF58 family)
VTTRSAEPRNLRQAIDWGSLGPLRLRAREAARGIYAGGHRSVLRGAGVEFGGHRQYVAGDDLRRLDRRSLLLHQRLLVRQFETETDRALCLLVDATASMAYRGPDAPGSKVAFAALLAAALARLAIVGGDPVGVTIMGGDGAFQIERARGTDPFDRIVAGFESLTPAGDVVRDPAIVERALVLLSRAARPGAIVVALGDLFDWPAGAADRLASLASRRALAVVQTLDPAEEHFSFSGTVRLRSLEGDGVVETDADTARASYLGALAAAKDEWRRRVTARGGRFLSVTTASSPVAALRSIVESVRG